MLRIGISYHGGDDDYDEYERALRAQASAVGVQADAIWLAGAGRPFLTHRLVGLDAMVFTGGADVGDAGERDAIENALMEHALRSDLPLLAICRGAQLLNVFHGGSLFADLAERNEAHCAPPRKQHEVRLEAGSLLAEIAGATRGIVNSSHHQAVDRLANGFRITATAPDGVIEGFERTNGGALLFAVQWHPELMANGQPLAGTVFAALVRAAASRSVARGTLIKKGRPLVPRRT
jgi:GMP synthase-like glutamine amidotransferase